MFELKQLSPGGDLTDAFWVRDEVFTKEQGFSEPDSDQYDAVSDHVVFYDGGKPAATGRTYCDDDQTTFHLGRIAVLKEYRGCQLGKAVMDELEKLARAKGAHLLLVGAQLYAVPFYQKCGFTPTGERYFDEFCEHEMLTKTIAL